MRDRGVCVLVVCLLLPACGDPAGKDAAPQAPSDLAVAAATSGQSVLIWKDNTPDETAFLVERSADAGTTWTTALSAPADATSAVDAGLEPARTYHYRVRALFPWGASSPSGTVPSTLPNMSWGAPPGSPSGLGARAGACAVYDPVGRRMLLVGGDSPDGFRSDVWALALDGPDLTTAAWSELSPDGTPPEGRSHSAAVYDPVRRRLILFGGFGFAGLSSEVWTLSLPASGTPAWSPLSPAGGPSPRMAMTAVYDAAGDRVVIHGGVVGASQTAETWALRLSGTGAPSWANLGPGPKPLAEHVAVYDPEGRRMIVYGGAGNATPNGATYSLALPLESEGLPYAWSELVPEASAPLVPRAAASAVLDAANRRLVVCGGYDPSLVRLDEVWMLPLSGPPVWSAVVPSGSAPPPRSYGSAAYDADLGRMILFSGFDVDLWEFIDDAAWPLQF